MEGLPTTYTSQSTRRKEFKMTDEQKRIYHHNNRLARKILNPPKNFVMHHKDTILKYTDIDRYIEWRIEDLVVLSRSEHMKVHQSETPYRKGKTNSEEHRKNYLSCVKVDHLKIKALR